MSDNNDFDPDDLHTQLIKEFWMYSHWQDRFERYGYSGSAASARRCLKNIRKLAHSRYHEIQSDLKELKKNQNRGKKKDTDDN